MGNSPGATDALALALVLNDGEAELWTSTPQPYRERDALEWFATHADSRRETRFAALALIERSGPLPG